MTRCVLLLIRLYRLLLSPWLGQQCRFEPTCSCYAHEAFERYGFWRGLHLTVTRLLACRPGGRYGYDPVP